MNTAAREATDARTGGGADRWGLLWHGFFAATLAWPTVVAAAAARSRLDAAVIVGTATAFGIWHWWMAVRHGHWEGRLPMLVWFAGALLFTGVLLGQDSYYLILVYGLYPQVFALLGRFAVPGAVALTVLIFWRNGVLFSGPVSDWGTAVLGSVLLALLIGLFVTALVRQSTARKAALEQLEATRAQLAATARRAGILQERQRMARELHDTVAQGFTGIVMQLEACEQALASHPHQAREHLTRARSSARDSLAELRRAARAMRPRALEEATLPEALDATVRRWTADTGTPATAACEGAVLPLQPDQEVALLRAAQEALANVAKHARAHRAAVRLVYRPDCVEVAVTDDGVGFDPSAGRGDGVGLQGIAERMAAVGGSMTIDSAPGRGTAARFRIAVP